MAEFARFPLSLNNLGLTGREYRQLLLEINYSNTKGYHWHSAEDIAETLGVTIHTVRDTWTGLSSKGAIERTDNKELNRWETHIIALRDLTEGVRDLTEGGTGFSRRGVRQNVPIIEEPKKEPKKEPIKKRHTKKDFVKPTQEEVKEYASDKCPNVDYGFFFNFYDSADWHDSNGKPVVSWKQKMITWSKRDKDKSPTAKAKSFDYCPKHPTMKLDGNGICNMCQSEQEII